MRCVRWAERLEILPERGAFYDDIHRIRRVGKELLFDLRIGKLDIQCVFFYCELAVVCVNVIASFGADVDGVIIRCVGRVCYFV